MARKLFGLSIMWILVLLAILYFVFGVGRVKEGICVPAGQKCANITSCSASCCKGQFGCNPMGTSSDRSDDTCRCV
jgi:hypothetical protein